MDLNGRNFIITGANQGLGRVIAEQFVGDGASVFLTARGEEKLRLACDELRQMAAGGHQRIEILQADIGNDLDCALTIREALNCFDGKITGLINNAGVYGPMGPIEEVDWTEWLDAIRINLLGTVMMCRQIIPHLRKAGYGKIINLSGGGATAPLPRISAYAASKAAIVRLTETFAQELLDAHVDVNAIAPGALNTRLLDEVLTAGPEKVGSSFYEKSLKQRDQGGAPLERGAALASFLASAASDGITGRLLSAVWDDWENLPARREKLSQSDVFTLRRIVPEDRAGW